MKLNLLGSIIGSITLSVTLCSAATNITIDINAGEIKKPFVLDQNGIHQTQLTDFAAGGRAAFKFTITKAAAYRISARVNAPNSAENSFFVYIDVSTNSSTMIWDIPITQGFEQREVSWRGSGTPEKNEFTPIWFHLAEGVHTLVIVGREPNSLLNGLTLIEATKPTPPQNLRIAATSP